MTPIVVTPPSEEPITLDEAKAHLRQTYSDDDAYITALITAARQLVEGYTNRALMPQRIRIGMDGFCAVTKLPRLPFKDNLSAPPVEVKYIDENGAQQTLPESTYYINQYVEPVQVSLASGQSWPTITRVPAGVTMEYDVGYADADAVPGPLKQWMLLAIGAMYDHRDELTAGVEVYCLPKEFMSLLWQPYMVYE